MVFTDHLGAVIIFALEGMQCIELTANPAIPTDRKKRHFAQTEINALISLFVASFEIQDAKNGIYTLPSFKITVNIGGAKPAYDVEVKMQRRKGYENVEWRFEM